MYLSIEDKEIEKRQNEVENKNQLLIEEAESLSWFERTFGNRHEELKKQIIQNWQNFSIWQDNRMRSMRNTIY